jgi:hypothetical protein
MARFSASDFLRNGPCLAAQLAYKIVENGLQGFYITNLIHRLEKQFHYF